MSRTRVIIFVLLVTLLGGACWIIGRGLFSRSPTWQLAKARQAVAEGDQDAARIHLMTLLRDHPDHSEGHLLISEVILAEAAEDGKPATYQTNDEAREHLRTAARLRPDDIDLQKKLLGIALDQGRMQAAAEVAETVAKTEPNDPDVLLALAAKAIDDEDFASAAARLEALVKMDAPRVFQASAQAIRLYRAGSYPVERAKALAGAVNVAAGRTPQQLRAMDLREQQLMTELIRMGVAEAADVPTAHARATVALEVCEKIARSKRHDPAMLAAFMAGVMTALRTQHPLDAATSSELPARRALQERADNVFDEAMRSGTASPVVYREAAFAAFDLLEHERVRSILQEGIVKFQALPGDGKQQLLQLHLLAARNLIVMRRHAEARASLDALQSSSDANFAGWGQLLAGCVASLEGRYETALQHYAQAEGKLGRTPLLNIALARTFLELQQWQNALERLAVLDRLLATPDVEQKAWFQAHELFEEDIQWGKLTAFLALDRWDEAQRQIRDLRGTRREPDAIAAAARYLWEKGQRAESLSLLTTERERLPRALGLLQTHVSLLTQAGRDAEAAELVEQLSDQDDLASQLFLARWRFGQGQRAAAIELLDAVEQRFPEDPTPKFLKARLLLAMGESRAALAIANQLRESPQTAAEAELLGLTQSLQETDLAAAAEQMQRLEDAVPSVTPGMDILAGIIAAEQGDFSESLGRARKNLDVENLAQPARRLLLKSLLLMSAREGPDSAAAALAPLLREHPDDAFLRIVEADLHFQNGQFTEGMQALNRLEQLEPDRPTAACLKAAAWRRAGNIRRALEEVDRALTMDSQFEPALNLAARLHLANNQPERAAEIAAAALADNPGIEPLYLVRADAFGQLDRREEAVQLLQEAFEQEPRFLAVYRGLLSLLLEDGRPEEALQVCRRARDRRPREFVFATDEIAILCRQQQLELARQVAREAVGAPPDPGRCLSVAKTFAAVNLRDDARRWAERALEFADDSLQPAVHLMLGDLALREGREQHDRPPLEAARDHYAEVLKSHPRHLSAGNNLAWLLVTEFDQIEPALEIMQRVRGEASVRELPPSFLGTLAFVLRRAGRLEEAREMLEQALTLHPDDGELMFHLGMVLAEQGRNTAAVESLKRALQLGGHDPRRVAEAQQTLASLNKASED